MVALVVMSPEYNICTYMYQKHVTITLLIPTVFERQLHKEMFPLSCHYFYLMGM